MACINQNDPDYKRVLAEVNGNERIAREMCRDWIDVDGKPGWPDSAYVEKKLHGRTAAPFDVMTLNGKEKWMNPADRDKGQRARYVAQETLGEGFNAIIAGPGNVLPAGTPFKHIGQLMSTPTAVAARIGKGMELNQYSTPGHPNDSEESRVGIAVRDILSKLNQKYVFVGTVPEMDGVRHLIMQDRTSKEHVMVTAVFAHDDDFQRNSSFWKLDKNTNEKGYTDFDRINVASSSAMKLTNWDAKKTKNDPEYVTKRYLLPIGFSLNEHGEVQDMGFAKIRNQEPLSYQRPAGGKFFTTVPVGLYRLHDTSLTHAAWELGTHEPATPARGTLASASLVLEESVERVRRCVERFSEKLHQNRSASPGMMQLAIPPNSWDLKGDILTTVRNVTDFIEEIQNKAQDPSNWRHDWILSQSLEDIRRLKGFVDTLEQNLKKPGALSYHAETIMDERTGTPQSTHAGGHWEDDFRSMVNDLSTALYTTEKVLMDGQNERVRANYGEELDSMIDAVFIEPRLRELAISSLREKKERIKVGQQDSEDRINAEIERLRNDPDTVYRPEQRDKRGAVIALEETMDMAADRLRDAIFGYNGQGMSSKEAAMIFGSGLMKFVVNSGAYTKWLVPIKDRLAHTGLPLKVLASARWKENHELNMYKAQLDPIVEAIQGDCFYMINERMDRNRRTQSIVRPYRMDEYMKFCNDEAYKRYVMAVGAMGGHQAVPIEQRRQIFRDCQREVFRLNSNPPKGGERGLFLTIKERLRRTGETLHEMGWMTDQDLKDFETLRKGAKDVNDLRAQIWTKWGDVNHGQALVNAMDSIEMNLRTPKSKKFRDAKYEAIMAMADDDPRKKFYLAYTDMMDDYNNSVPNFKRLSNTLSSSILDPNWVEKTEDPIKDLFDSPWDTVTWGISEEMEKTQRIPLHMSKPADDPITDITGLAKRLLETKSSLLHYQTHLPAYAMADSYISMAEHALQQGTVDSNKLTPRQRKILAASLKTVRDYMEKTGYSLEPEHTREGLGAKILSGIMTAVGWTTLGFSVSTAWKSHIASMAELHGAMYGVNEHMDYKHWAATTADMLKLSGGYTYFTTGNNTFGKLGQLVDTLVPDRQYFGEKTWKNKVDRAAYGMFSLTDNTHTRLIAGTIARGTELYDASGQKLGSLYDLFKDGRVPDAAVQVMHHGKLRPWNLDYTRREVADVISATVHMANDQNRPAGFLDKQMQWSLYMKNLGITWFAQMAHGPNYNWHTGEYSHGGMYTAFTGKGAAYAWGRMLGYGRILNLIDNISQGQWAEAKLFKSVQGEALSLSDREQVRSWVRCGWAKIGTDVAAALLLGASRSLLGVGNQNSTPLDVLKRVGSYFPIVSVFGHMAGLDDDVYDDIRDTADDGSDDPFGAQWRINWMANNLIQAASNLSMWNQLAEQAASVKAMPEILGGKGTHLVKAVAAMVRWIHDGDEPTYDNDGPYRHLFENKFYEEMSKVIGFGPYDIERLKYVGNNIRRYYTE